MRGSANGSESAVLRMKEDAEDGVFIQYSLLSCLAVDEKALTRLGMSSTCS